MEHQPGVRAVNARGLALAWLIAIIAALIVYPSACTYSTAPRLKNCRDTVVEHHHGHRFKGSDTIYVGDCNGDE